MNPFDFVKDIQQGKSDVIRNSENPEKAEAMYNPYIVNRALSFYIDGILHANEMNQRPGLDHLMQFDYLLNSIRSMKRKHAWIKKPEEDADLEMLSQHFNVSTKIARDYLRILNKHQLDTIRKRTNKGGP